MKDSIKFGDKDYALVPGRLKKFREANPRAGLDTVPTIHEDGSVTFKATIIQDRANEYSATATGNAHYSASEIKKPKAFEKLETISLGRALANIGYLNDGQIATTEEMEEFEAYKNTKIDEAVEKLTRAESIEALKITFLGLGELMAKPEVVEAKDKRKVELYENTKV
jgi:hypothetical protein